MPAQSMPVALPSGDDPTLWHRLVIDTAVTHFFAYRSTMRRFDILATAAGMPTEAFMNAVHARYAESLKRDRFGHRPIEIEAFRTRLENEVTNHRDAARALRELKLLGNEAERLASIERKRRRLEEQRAQVRGMAALLAAAAMVGRSPPEEEGKPLA